MAFFGFHTCKPELIKIIKYQTNFQNPPLKGLATHAAKVPFREI